MPHINTLIASAAIVLLLAGCGQAPEPAGQATPSELTGPPSELLIQTLESGDGDVVAPGNTAVVHYTGWLFSEDAQDNKGTQFDSSRPRGQPLRFVLGEGRVIRGWEQGVEGMRIGEMRRLIIPPELAYGDRGAGRGAIPPGAVLVFDVELLGIE